MCTLLCSGQNSEFCKDCNSKIESIYTSEDWSKDKYFKASKQQEITEQIYNDFMDCLPPLNLPRNNLSYKISSGFMNSEPYTHSEALNGKWTAYYSAFAKGNDGKYYYLGLMNKYGEWLTEERN